MISEMMFVMSSNRPNCDEILGKKDLWALSLKDMESDPLMNKYLNEFLKKPSNSEDFELNFIKQKMEYRQCSHQCTHFCISCNSGMLSKTKFRNKKLKTNK